MEHGMNTIRNLYESPFSPQIMQARLQRRFYKSHLTMKKTWIDLRRQLSSIESVLEAPLPAPRTLAEAQAMLTATQKNVRDLNKRAASLRILYLEEQAMLLEGSDDPKAADIRRRILKAEQLTQMFKKLRSYLRPNQHSSLSHVMVPADGKPPKEATKWKRVSDPEDVETAILDKNSTHFGQGHGTPFTIGALGSIPFNGMGPLADSILNGTAESTHRVTQMVLDQLKKPAGIPNITSALTKEEFAGKLNNWKKHP
jgi:hypothetical protein